MAYEQAFLQRYSRRCPFLSPGTCRPYPIPPPKPPSMVVVFARKMVLFSHVTCRLTKVNRKGPFSFAPYALFFKTMVISGHILFDFFITCTKECKLKFFSPPCRVINIVGSYQTHDVSRTPVCFGFF